MDANLSDWGGEGLSSTLILNFIIFCVFSVVGRASEQIWTNRLLKELDGVNSRLPPGVSLSSHDMEPEAGVCRAYFEASLAAPGERTGNSEGGGRWGGKRQDA